MTRPFEIVIRSDNYVAIKDFAPLTSFADQRAAWIGYLRWMQTLAALGFDGWVGSVHVNDLKLRRFLYRIGATEYGQDGDTIFVRRLARQPFGVVREKAMPHTHAYTLPSKDITYIFDPETGESFPVMAGGSGDVKIPPPPAPTPEETALMKLQEQAAQQQIDIAGQQQSFGNFLTAQMGYQYDPTTKSYTEIPGNKQAEIRQLTQDRYLAALKGELPVDPALERSLTEQEQKLRAGLEKNLGSGYETSSPGQNALADFNKRAEELRYGVRTGELTTSAALQQSQYGLTGQAASPIGQAANTYGAAAGTAQMPLSDLAHQRDLEFQARMQSELATTNRRDAFTSSLLNLGGQAGGTAAALYMYCCPKGAMVRTPNGPVPIENIRKGDEVSSLNDQLQRVVVRVAEVVVRGVPSGHRLSSITFDDGSRLRVSPTHPMADGLLASELTEGTVYRGKLVAEYKTIPYLDRCTYDILPDTPSGLYWLDGILVGSTLNITEVVHGT